MTRDLFHSSITAIVVALAMSVPAAAQDAPAATADAPTDESGSAPATTSEQAAPAGETEPPAADGGTDAATAPPAASTDPVTDATGTTPAVTSEQAAPVGETEPPAADPSADAAATPADPAMSGDAACPALAIIEEGSGKVERVKTLVQDELAQPTNLITAYRSFSEPVTESLSEGEYDAECYKAAIRAVAPLSTDKISGVQPNALGDDIVAVWTEKCSEMTDGDGILMCFQDTATALDEDLLTDTQVIRLLRGLPIETVTLDDSQIDSMLLLVKEQVDAGNLTGSAQGQIVDRLMNQ